MQNAAWWRILHVLNLGLTIKPLSRNAAVRIGNFACPGLSSDLDMQRVFERGPEARGKSKMICMSRSEFRLGHAKGF